MKLQSYFPIIKTTDAELKGYKNLSYSAKKNITPVFELTRSRTTSKVPRGDITRRLDNILEATEGLPFVLDLTSHEDLMNYQIEELLDEEDGFSNWTNFVSSVDSSQIIPAIHMVDGCEPENLSAQLKKISDDFLFFALRISVFDDDLNQYLSTIEEILGREIRRLLLILDAEYLESHSYSVAKKRALRTLGELAVIDFGMPVVICGSSFPKYVVSLPGCSDSIGEIPLLEWELFNQLRAAYPRLLYGDYGSIHPIRNQQGGGNWVPRIDYPLSEKVIYTRYRQEHGGYERCAEELVDLEEYDNLSCWGSEQIIQAASHLPPGKSPAFWIAARLNIHCTRKLQDLGAE